MSVTKARFEAKDGKLFIDGKEVIKGFESFSGWFWFATELDHIQDSIINGKVHPCDKIYFGYVQGLCNEWGYFSEAEINSLKPKTWEIKPQDLPFAGRR